MNGAGFLYQPVPLCVCVECVHVCGCVPGFRDGSWLGCAYGTNTSTVLNRCHEDVHIHVFT